MGLRPSNYRIKISLYLGRKSGVPLMPLSRHAETLAFEAMHDALRAVAEGTRLRILALLAETELTVSDLTEILRQSQPRISRHLKLLRGGPDRASPRRRLGVLSDGGPAAKRGHRPAAEWRGWTEPTCRAPAIAKGSPRCAKRAPRQRKTISARMRPNGTDCASCTLPRRPWKSDRAALGGKPFRSLLDLGTGTGRMLELFGPATSAGSASTCRSTCCCSRARGSNAPA